MAHTFPLKEIALQSGLSLATVDRVIHDRSGVRKSTIARVYAAQAELERQRDQAALSGRRIVLDVVMEAPDRFSKAVQMAIEAELPAFRPANIRCRFHTTEVLGEDEIVRHLNRLAARGTHGIILKAPDTPKIRNAVARLLCSKIAVVTFATEVGGLAELPYVGMDNRQAGATAAWCLGNLCGDNPATVLVTLSSFEFSGERTRLDAFQDVLKTDYKHLRTVVVSEGFGGNRRTGKLVSETLDSDPSINAVYSAGGANRAILTAFKNSKRTCIGFVGHDLDDDNRALISRGDMDAVIHHDLRQDARSACQIILKHNQMLPANLTVAPTRVDICTRHNLEGANRIP